MPPEEDNENPYAASSLYEPTAADPPLPPLISIVARGNISWGERRQAHLLAYAVSNRDLLSMTLQAFILMFCFGFLAAIARAGVPLVFMTPLFLFGLLHLAWRRRRALREAHAEQSRQGDRWCERQITNDGILTRRGAEQEFTPWQDYALCRLDGDLMVLVRRHPASFQAFPRSHFENEDDWQLFQCALRTHIQQV